MLRERGAKGGAPLRAWRDAQGFVARNCAAAMYLGMETIPEKLPRLSKNHPFSIGNDKCIFLNGGCSIVILVFLGVLYDVK